MTIAEMEDPALPMELSFWARRHSIDLFSVQNPWWLIRAIGDYTTVTNRIENITKHELGNPYITQPF